MKKFEAHIDYTEIIKDNNWLNDDFRPCVILMEDAGYNEVVKAHLTQLQVDHLAFMFAQDGRRVFHNIEKQAKEYELQNRDPEAPLNDYIDELMAE